MEPYYNEYKHHLDQLTSIIRNSGARPEGNMFFYDGNNYSTMPEAMFLSKRQNIARLATMVDAIVEIGFNAGHSALLMLTANPSLIYRGVDVGRHLYVEPCSEYLKSQFGNRFNLTINDSVKAIPKIFAIYPELQNKTIGWHIDGDHTPSVAAKDLKNVVNLSGVKDTIIMDDTDSFPLRELIEQCAADDRIDIVFDTYNQTFAKVRK